MTVDLFLEMFLVRPNQNSTLNILQQVEAPGKPFGRGVFVLYIRYWAKPEKNLLTTINFLKDNVCTPLLVRLDEVHF